MPELFKYKNINEYTLYSLINKYLYFARPKELDDIFECKICPDFSHTTDGEIQSWITSFQQYQTTTFPYKTVSDIRSAISSGELYKHYLNNSEIFEKYHILSLAQERDNQQLWSLYADTYKGICIGYNVQPVCGSHGKKYALQIIDPKSTYPNSNIISPFICYDQPVAITLSETKYCNEGQFSYDWITEKMYDNTNKLFPKLLFDGKSNSGDRQKSYQLIMNSKSKIWKAQNEFRAIYHEGDTPIPKLYYPDETLASVTFGYNLDDDKRNEIYSMVKSNYSNFNSIRFEIAEPDYSTRQIKFTTYKP